MSIFGCKPSHSGMAEVSLVIGESVDLPIANIQPLVVVRGINEDQVKTLTNSIKLDSSQPNMVRVCVFV